jgi:fatty-acyl-CoA synthase
MDGELRRQTLPDLLHRSAKRFPNKTAIICGDTAWSYADFAALCDRLAAGLAARGVCKGTRVAILARNSHPFAALRFALARLGAILVPINFMLKAEEVAFILRHAGAEMLAVDSSLAEVVRAAGALDTKVREFVWLPSEEKTTPVPGMIAFDELLSNSAEPPQVELSGNDLAQIVYTSGNRCRKAPCSRTMP